MITADQLLLHLIGDYLTQSDWMAINKVKRIEVACLHALVYALPFFALNSSLSAWSVIFASHALIDRFRLARYVCWVKNFLAPKGVNPPWVECDGTGYPRSRPDWLTVWLMIIADNILHIAINGLALRFL